MKHLCAILIAAPVFADVCGGSAGLGVEYMAGYRVVDDNTLVMRVNRFSTPGYEVFSCSGLISIQLTHDSQTSPLPPSQFELVALSLAYGGGVRFTDDMQAAAEKFGVGADRTEYYYDLEALSALIAQGGDVGPLCACFDHAPYAVGVSIFSLFEDLPAPGAAQ